MSRFRQGDIIKIEGYNNLFYIISKNSFIKATGVFHVCPVLSNIKEGPLHIKVGDAGIVICEQIKLIDPSARTCNKVSDTEYADIMNISDAIQGIFEYD